MQKIRWGLSALGVVALLMAFQNCGQPQVAGVTSEASSVSQAAGGVLINKNVVSNESAVANAILVVNPEAIDFTNVANSDQPLFHLVLSSGQITRLSDGQAISQLAADQLGILQALLQDTIVSNPVDLPGGDQLMCAQVIKLAYARLITDQGTYALGAGNNACATDLFKRSTNQSAGLRAFLGGLSI